MNKDGIFLEVDGLFVEIKQEEIFGFNKVNAPLYRWNGKMFVKLGKKTGSSHIERKDREKSKNHE